MRRCSRRFADDLRRVAHLAEFFEDGLDATGPNEKGAIRESPRDFLREFLPREALLGKHGIFREDEAEEEEADDDAEAEVEAEVEADVEAEPADDEGGDEDEDGVKKKKKKKVAVKKKAAPKVKKPAVKRVRTAKEVRQRAVWIVFDNSSKEVGSFNFNQKGEAEKLLEKKILEKEGKVTFYLNLVKREIKEEKDKDKEK